MRLHNLIFLLAIGLSSNIGVAGTLAGDWYLEDSKDASISERRAFSLPISQSTEATQVTLGIKSPGLEDPIDFYLVVSGKTTDSNCQYAVNEIVIDSKSFSVKSTTHSSDIPQITTRTADKQRNLWREFRKGQNLSLRIHQKCNEQSEPSSEVNVFDFSLKGSSAAYRFVAREEVTPDQKQSNVIIDEPLRTAEPRNLEVEPNEEPSNSVLIAFLVVSIVVVLIIIYSRRQPKSIYTDATPGLSSEELAPLRRENYRATKDTDKAPIGFHINREPDRAPVHGYDKETSNFPRFRVEHVIDGDTVIVSKHKKKHTIRLDSIDCPEDGQEWGNNATAGLIKLIGGRHVHVEEHTQDHYERMVATLYVYDEKDSEWVNVNEKMVMRGHAWVMRKYYNHLPEPRQIKLNRLERWARSKKVGLWKLPNPVPPWKWRKI